MCYCGTLAGKQHMPYPYAHTCGACSYNKDAQHLAGALVELDEVVAGQTINETKVTGRLFRSVAIHHQLCISSQRDAYEMFKAGILLP